jgi:hypothetical protein
VSPAGGPENRGALVDGRGCLTAAGFAVLSRAPVGRAPADLAAHLAGCARCQERMLAGGAPARPAPRSPGRRAPRLWLGVGFALLALLLALGALILAGRAR